METLKKSRYEQRLASTIACGYLKYLVRHTMGKLNRADMHAEIRKYHSEIQKDKLDWTDIKASYSWDESWNYWRD